MAARQTHKQPTRKLVVGAVAGYVTPPAEHDTVTVTRTPADAPPGETG